MMTIEDVIWILENAERIGRDEDSPEGVRYIQISDTLVQDMVDALKSTITPTNVEVEVTEEGYITENPKRQEVKYSKPKNKTKLVKKLFCNQIKI